MPEIGRREKRRHLFEREGAFLGWLGAPEIGWLSYSEEF